ncbi:MAG: Holliday junction resolvase-like protein [Treponema sp.]
MNEIYAVIESVYKNHFAVFCALFAFLLLVSFALGHLIGKLKAEKKHAGVLKSERQDAVKRSRSVINGQIIEQIAPLLPDFPARYSEVSFLGKPVDFIGFCGLDNSKDENEQCRVDEILFIEIKTGDAKLSEREKAIKQAVDEKRVRYVVWRKQAKAK